MKKHFLFLVIIGFFYSSCELGTTIYGSGDIVSKNRRVANFENVSTSSIIDVVISYGTEQSVKIWADDNVIDNVITKVTNNSFGSKWNMEIIITLPFVLKCKAQI